MADTTSKAAVGLSAVAIAVSASVAYLQLLAQAQLQSTTAKVNFELSAAAQGMAAAQVCLNWAGFVDTQRRNGLSDLQIDRLGQVVFAPADLVLQAVAKFNDQSQSLDPGLTETARQVRQRLAPGSIGVPDVQSGIRVFALCGSAETLRAARDTHARIVPLEQLESPGSSLRPGAFPRP